MCAVTLTHRLPTILTTVHWDKLDCGVQSMLVLRQGGQCSDEDQQEKNECSPASLTPPLGCSLREDEVRLLGIVAIRSYC